MQTLQTHRTPKDIRDDVAAQVPLREVKQGEYFRVNQFDKGVVYQRGHYCAGNRISRFSIVNQENGNERLMPGDKLVYVGFEY